MNAAIVPIKMPKWGLSMQEGKVVHWWKQPGDRLSDGDDLVDIETSKITNTDEARTTGVLRRILAEPDETLPVGALLAVVADETASDAEIDAFVEAFQANFVPEAAEAEGEGALALRMVEVAGHALNVGLAGEGSVPVVLIHGFSGDLNNWLFNLDALKARGPVIAIDLPGHGVSSKDVGDGSLAVLAGALAGALDALGVERAHLVGHSLGAAVALRLAQDLPHRVRSLSLIAPAGLPGSIVDAAFLDGMVEAQRARDLKPWLELLFVDPSLVSREMTEDMARYKRLDGVPEALAAIRDRMLHGADFAELRARLAGRPPTLVVLGDQDRIAGAPDLAALPSEWRIVTLSGAGHMPHLEQATKINALLTQFLAEIP